METPKTLKRVAAPSNNWLADFKPVELPVAVRPFVKERFEREQAKKNPRKNYSHLVTDMEVVQRQQEDQE